MMYMHFERTGHSLRHSGQNPDSDVDSQYKQASKDGIGGQSVSNSGLPPYINRESPEEAHWRKLHPEGWKAVSGAAILSSYSHILCRSYPVTVPITAAR